MKGSDGLQGADGAQGVKGSDGLQGADGAQGVKGSDGLQGADGAQGINGIQGLKGSDGIGVQGLQGLVGIQGKQGTQGARGLQGASGSGGSGSGTKFHYFEMNTAANNRYKVFNIGNTVIDKDDIIVLHYVNGDTYSPRTTSSYYSEMLCCRRDSSTAASGSLCYFYIYGTSTSVSADTVSIPENSYVWIKTSSTLNSTYTTESTTFYLLDVFAPMSSNSSSSSSVEIPKSISMRGVENPNAYISTQYIDDKYYLTFSGNNIYANYIDASLGNISYIYVDSMYFSQTHEYTAFLFGDSGISNLSELNKSYVFELYLMCSVSEFDTSWFSNLIQWIQQGFCNSLIKFYAGDSEYAEYKTISFITDTSYIYTPYNIYGGTYLTVNYRHPKGCRLRVSTMLTVLNAL